MIIMTSARVIMIFVIRFFIGLFICVKNCVLYFLPFYADDDISEYLIAEEGTDGHDVGGLVIEAVVVAVHAADITYKTTDAHGRYGAKPGDALLPADIPTELPYNADEYVNDIHPPFREESHELLNKFRKAIHASHFQR
jgi:hypothetical protein